jgi:hypothetical protein
VKKPAIVASVIGLACAAVSAALLAVRLFLIGGSTV